LKQVVEVEPIAPRLLNLGIPRDLETICLKCLEKNVARRYPTAHELADELTRYLDGKPIQARPVSAAGKVWKWCGRRPALAGMTAALVLSFALGLIGVSWQWSRASARELTARRNAYAGDMNLLQTALNEGDYGRALAHLEAARPAPGQRDLRGWEWRYFWQRCRSHERACLCRYPEGVSELAFSPDGRWLALRQYRGAVVLWDVVGKRPEAELAGAGNPQALALPAHDQLPERGPLSPRHVREPGGILTRRLQAGVRL
jgi:hypothetical protein